MQASGTAFGEWSGEELLEKLQSANTMASIGAVILTSLFLNTI